MRLQVPPVRCLGFRKTIFIIIMNKSGLYVFGKIKDIEYSCENGKIFKYLLTLKVDRNLIGNYSLILLTLHMNYPLAVD